MRKYTDISTQDPIDRPTWVDGIDNPYLHGPYTPVVSEVTAIDLKVNAGKVPDDLYGAYMRQGPNPIFEPKGPYHWFDGDGMVHGMYFRDGRASYIRKWTQTRALHDEIERGRVELSGIMGPYDVSRVAGRENVAMNPDYCKDTANTTLNLHNGKLLAAWYNSGRMHALDPLTLETSGEETFHGGLDTSMNAHGKVDVRMGASLIQKYEAQENPIMMGLYQFMAEGRASHVWATMAECAGDEFIQSRYSRVARDEKFHSQIGRMMLEKVCVTEEAQQECLNYVQEMIWDLIIATRCICPGFKSLVSNGYFSQKRVIHDIFMWKHVKTVNLNQ